MKNLIILLILPAIILFSVSKTRQTTPSTPPQTTNLIPFVSRLNQKIGYMDIKGTVVIPPQFDQSCWDPRRRNCMIDSLTDANFSEGLAKVKVNRRYGYINEKGEVKIKAEYESSGKFSNGLAWIKSNGKYGYINTEGQLKIPATFDSASDFSERLGKVQINAKYGFIDQSGNMVIEPQFTDAGNFSNGLVRINKNNKYGYFDKQLKEVIRPTFDSAGDFSDGLARVSLWNRNSGYRHGYINDKGDLILNPIYESAADFSDGLAIIKTKSESTYSYIDKNGNRVLTVPKGDPQSFKNGLALLDLGSEVLKSEFYGGEGRRGPRSECPYYFEIKERLKVAYIDKTGKVIYEGTSIVYHRCVAGMGPDSEIYNEAPLVDVSIDSKPTPALLYLVTKWDWEHTPDICTRLSNYFVGNTIYSQRIIADNYMLILESQSKRYLRPQDFEPNLKNSITVDLINETKCP